MISDVKTGTFSYTRPNILTNSYINWYSFMVWWLSGVDNYIILWHLRTHFGYLEWHFDKWYSIIYFILVNVILLPFLNHRLLKECHEGYWSSAYIYNKMHTEGFRMSCPKMLHFDMWITLSWTQSLPKRFRKNLYFPLTASKNLDKGPAPRRGLYQIITTKNLGKVW